MCMCVCVRVCVCVCVHVCVCVCSKSSLFYDISLRVCASNVLVFQKHKIVCVLCGIPLNTDVSCYRDTHPEPGVSLLTVLFNTAHNTGTCSGVAEVKLMPGPA